MEGQNLGLHKFSTAVRIRFVEYSRNTYEAYDICVQSDTKRTLLKKILVGISLMIPFIVNIPKFDKLYIHAKKQNH